MRDRGTPLAERAWAWVRWRALSNHSECPVTDWNPAYAKKLGQIDCGVDLTWLAEGKSLEWVEKASADLRAAKAKVIGWPKLKGDYSRAFAKNKRRGLLDFKGQTIYIVPVPPSEPPPEKLVIRTTFDSDPEFLAWWKVGDPPNFQAYQAAQKAYNEVKKVGRNAYREWAARTTSEPAVLITEKTDKNNEGSSSSSVFPNVELEGPDEEEDAPLQTKAEPEPEPIPEPAFDPAAGFAELQAEYPPGRMDVAASRAAHREVVKTVAEQRRLMEGFHCHMGSERWRRSLAESNPPGRFIPMCSKFIRAQQYADTPPPYVDLVDAKAMKRQDRDRKMFESLREWDEKRWKAAAGGKP